MPSILDEIVAAKRVELAESKDRIPLAALESEVGYQARPLNLSGALLGGGVRLIVAPQKRTRLYIRCNICKLVHTVSEGYGRGGGEKAVYCCEIQEGHCSVTSVFA